MRREDGFRSRDRRRGRREGVEGYKRNGLGEKFENGFIKNDFVDKGLFDKEDTKIVVNENRDYDSKKSINQENGFIEKIDEVKKEIFLFEGFVVNGAEIYVDSSSNYCLNGEFVYVLDKEEEKNKDVLF